MLQPPCMVRFFNDFNVISEHVGHVGPVSMERGLWVKDYSPYETRAQKVRWWVVFVGYAVMETLVNLIFKTRAGQR